MVSQSVSDQPVTVVGAGVAGLCVATELCARGIPVRLLDLVGPPGPHGCSWWAGGMLAPDCEGEVAAEVVVRLGRASAGWWQSHGVDVTHNGTLVLALGRDLGELDQFARRTSGSQSVDADALALLEPDLGGRFARGLHFAGEAHLDPRQALAALVAGLRARGCEIVSPETATPGEPGRVIDCRGLSARDALRDLRGVKGEMLVLRSPDLTLSRPVRLLHPRIPIYLVPRGDGLFMLGATQIESSDRSRATVRSVLELLSAAYALHPAFGEAEIVEIGVDARPAFPDNLPRLRLQDETLYVNGLYRHGYLMAPVLARMAADYFETGTIGELLHADHR